MLEPIRCNVLLGKLLTKHFCQGIEYCLLLINTKLTKLFDQAILVNSTDLIENNLSIFALKLTWVVRQKNVGLVE